MHYDMMKTPFIEYQPPNIAFSCSCVSDSRMKYSYAILHYESVLSGFLAVEMDFQLENLMLIPFVMGAILIIFMGCYAYANLLDASDEEAVCVQY